MHWRNHLLDGLSEDDAGLLRAHLESVALARNQPIVKAGGEVTFVHLPVDCILSVVTVMENGDEVESRTVGCEGAYGLLNVLGAPMSFEQVVCEVGGRCWRMGLAGARAAANRSASLREMIVRHAQATLTQSAQSIACNTLHRAEQRLCRWLLLSQDRVSGDVLPLTQEHLAIMLGVQRTTVTAVASQLQRRGMIAYSRGRIRVLDRAALERSACECYRAIRRGEALMLGHATTV